MGEVFRALAERCADGFDRALELGDVRLARQMAIEVRAALEQTGRSTPPAPGGVDPLEDLFRMDAGVDERR